jgi:hypothetical protein
MPELSPRDELIKIQKQIFRKNQRVIDDSILDGTQAGPG